MAAAYVQSNKNYSGATPWACAFLSSVTAGNLIVVGLARYSGGITSVSDSLGNTYHEIGTEFQFTADNSLALRMFYAYNIGGGACTVTVSCSTGTSLSIFVSEYSGIITTDPLDKLATAESSSAGTTANSGNTATISQADELLIGFGIQYAAGTVSVAAGANYSLRQSYTDNNNYMTGGLEDRVVSGAAAYNATMTWGSSIGWIMRVATFKAAAGSSPVTVSLNAAGLTAGGQAVTVVPGAVTIGLSSATLSASGPNATLVPGPVSIAIQAAAVSAAGQSASVVPGAASVSLSAASLAAAGQAVTSVPGAVAVALAAAGLGALGQSLTAIPGAVTISLGAASLAAGGQALTVQAGGASPVTVSLSAATLQALGQAATVVPGAVMIALQGAAIQADGQPSTVLPGPAAALLSSATLAAGGQSITVEPGAVTISLSAAALAASGQPAAVLPGAVAIALAAAALAASGQPVTLVIPGVRGNLSIVDVLLYALAALDGPATDLTIWEE